MLKGKLNYFDPSVVRRGDLLEKGYRFLFTCFQTRTAPIGMT